MAEATNDFIVGMLRKIQSVIPGSGGSLPLGVKKSELVTGVPSSAYLGGI